MGGSAVAEKNANERRKFKRIAVDFPVTYRIRGTTVLGRALDGCNEGLLVESRLALRTALQILGILKRKPTSRLRVEFTHKKSFRVEGEIRHFHLDFSGNEPCRFVVGLFLAAIA
jgi:hypothetical protein